MLLSSSTLGVEGHAGAPGWDWEEWQVIIHSHELAQNRISWLVHSWSTFGAKMSHGQIRIHKIHHSPDLGEATTFPLIVYFVPLHEAHIQMAFCFETPRWESRNSQNWDSMTLGPHNFVCRPPIEMTFESKVVALVESFSMVCCMPPARKEIGLILDF
jgi:hypothetical protein